MAHLIDKDALVAEIMRRKEEEVSYDEDGKSLASYADQIHYSVLDSIQDFINTLEVKEINSIVNHYDSCIQYTDRESAIKVHAEDYSFNIESELFQQLTPEQQKIWRKEIEQACVSGGYSGYSLAKDPRYKENVEVKEVDLELVTDWFDHIAQIADDRMTLTRQRMTDSHALDEIKCIAKNSSEFITKHYKAQK